MMPFKDTFYETLGKIQVLSHFKNIELDSTKSCRPINPTFYEIYFNDIMRMYAQSTYLLFVSFQSTYWVKIKDIMFDQKLQIPIQLYQQSFYCNKNMFETVLDHFEEGFKKLIENKVSEAKINLFGDVVEFLKSKKEILKQKSYFNLMKELENLPFLKNNMLGLKIYSSSFVICLHQQKNNQLNPINEQMITEDSLQQEQSMHEYYQNIKSQEKEIMRNTSMAKNVNQINQNVQYSCIFIKDILKYPSFKRHVEQQIIIEEEKETQKWFKQLFYRYHTDKKKINSLLNEQQFQEVNKHLINLGIKMRGHFEFKKCIQAKINLSLNIDLNTASFKYFKNTWEQINKRLIQNYFEVFKNKKIFDYNPGTINVEYLEQKYLSFSVQTSLTSIIHDIFKTIDILGIILLILAPLLRKLKGNIQSNFISLDEINFYYQQIKRLIVIYYRSIYSIEIKENQ